MNKNNLMQPEMIQYPDYAAQIAEVLRSNLTPKLKQERMLDYHERDIAAALEVLLPEERKHLYRMLSTQTLADILEYSENKKQYLNELSVSQKIAVLSQFEISEMADFIREMDKNDRTTILELLDSDLRSQILLLHSFGEDEIGSKMTTNYISICSGSVYVRPCTS